MIANSWLITGPDTMPEEKRRRLRRLVMWREFELAGWVSRWSKDQFLELPENGTFMLDEWLHFWFSRRVSEMVRYHESVFLRLANR